MLFSPPLLADKIGSVSLAIRQNYNERSSVDFIIIVSQDRENGMPKMVNDQPNLTHEYLKSINYSQYLGQVSRYNTKNQRFTILTKWSLSRKAQEKYRPYPFQRGGKRIHDVNSSMRMEETVSRR